MHLAAVGHGHPAQLRVGEEELVPVGEAVVEEEQVQAQEHQVEPPGGGVQSS